VAARGEPSAQFPIEALVKHQPLHTRKYPFSENHVLILRAAKADATLGPALAAEYAVLFKKLSDVTGLRLNVNPKIYVVRKDDGLPEAYSFYVRERVNVLPHFAVIAPNASDEEKMRQIRNQAFTFQVINAALWHAPINKEDESYWFALGLASYASLRLAPASEAANETEHKANIAFTDPNVKRELFGFVEQTPATWDETGLKQSANAACLFLRDEVQLAALGAFLWMEKTGGEGAVQRVIESLEDICRAQKRCADSQAVFSMIERVIGEDIRTASSDVDG
jgi:hypothetical protein